MSEERTDRNLTLSTYRTSAGVVSIRLASPADASGIASVHVRGWQWAYRGLIPDGYLDGLSIVDRTKAWERILNQQSSEYRLWIPEHDGQIVGFCGTGRSRDADVSPEVAEVNAIYLEQSAAGQGIGRVLFGHAVSDLRDRGFRQATLWVLDANVRARRFYEAAGWRPDGTTKSASISGVDVMEARYRVALSRT